MTCGRIGFTHEIDLVRQTVEQTITNLSPRVEGTYELLPIELTQTSGEPEEYPLVQPLGEPLDRHQLWNDFLAMREVLSNTYIADRKGLLGGPTKEVQELLASAGFIAGVYTAIALMNSGTAVLKDEIPPYTRKVLKDLPGRPFRARYTTANPGWQTPVHSDAFHFRETGFRFNLPLNVPAHYSFQDNGKTYEYALEPGRIWFVNFCKLHRGFNPSREKRTSLLFQLDSDRWLS